MIIAGVVSLAIDKAFQSIDFKSILLMAHGLLLLYYVHTVTGPHDFKHYVYCK
jgi:hypothetical protein